LVKNWQSCNTDLTLRVGTRISLILGLVQVMRSNGPHYKFNTAYCGSGMDTRTAFLSCAPFIFQGEWNKIFGCVRVTTGMRTQCRKIQFPAATQEHEAHRSHSTALDTMNEKSLSSPSNSTSSGTKRAHIFSSAKSHLGAPSQSSAYGRQFSSYFIPCHSVRLARYCEHVAGS